MIVVTGLMAEARVAATPGIFVLAGGGGANPLAANIERAVREGGDAILSFGVAGGLSPDLEPGHWCIARNVISGSAIYCADPTWAQRLLNLIEGAELHDIVGSDALVARSFEKEALHASTGAATVDMESHIAARVAAAHRLPFAAIRVVADPVQRCLPPAALVGMRANGSMNISAVLNSVMRQPSQLGALVRIARDTRKAFRSLADARRMLGARFGYERIDDVALDAA